MSVTTLENSKIFSTPEETEPLSGQMDGRNNDDDGLQIISRSPSENSIPVQRKITVQNVSSKELDVGREDDEYDQFFEDEEDDDEEKQGLLKTKLSPFSFEIRYRNTTYDLSFPSCFAIYQRVNTTDFAPIYKIGWIVLTLYVMTQTLQRFDNNTGAFSGKTAAERVQINPHAAANSFQPITTYGYTPNQPLPPPPPMNNNNVPGLVVAKPQTFSQSSTSLRQNQNQPQDMSASKSQSQSRQPPPPQIQTPLSAELKSPALTNLPVALPMSPNQSQSHSGAFSSSSSTTMSNNNEKQMMLNNQNPFASLPPVLEENLSDITVPMSPTETSLFWHIPRSGGTTMKSLLGTCLQKVLASEVGILDGHDRDEQLQVFQRERPNGKFVNVDTMSIQGLTRANKLQLGNSGMAEVISTIHFREATDLFTVGEHHGRWFSLFRHPVHRAVSMFYYMNQMKIWGPNTELTLEEYINSDKVESNWMIRYLTGKKAGDVGLDDLNLAKEILRKKMLIGLYEEIDVSFDRFLVYFGWRMQGEDQRQCVDRLLHQQKIGETIHEPAIEGSEVWNRLATINNWDMRLYEYAIQLFSDQQNFVN